MESVDLKYFEELKRKVVLTFQKSYPNCNTNISEWKGQDITDFQEDLINKVHGRLSEKWFYTYIKSPVTKLPRIDMLNMLSEYAGYKNWNDFIGTNKIATNIVNAEDLVKKENHAIVLEKEEEKTSEIQTKKSNKGVKWLLLTISILVIFIFVVKAVTTKNHKYKCCFVDIDGHTPIKASVKIILLKEGESPVYAISNSEGCIELNEQNNKVSFIINTPYFQPDSFTRILTADNLEEKIQLKSDDYALMIHYFSKSKVDDWKKRRLQLNEMIIDNARVFQIYKNNEGMELYNKEEFIDKLTMPLKSLQNIDIIDVKYSGNKISELRFIQTDTK